MLMQYKNLWGSKGHGFDQQRADLFRVTLTLPAGVAGSGTVSHQLWEDSIQFALTKFPFPERARSVIPVKYMNQTNHMLGPDEAVGAIEIPVRYAFNARTNQVLERWNFLTSNPKTGGVSLTSRIKADGQFAWLVPNPALTIDTPSADAFLEAQVYALEGCMITGLKPSAADMGATGEGSLVMLEFKLQIDRYYPISLNDDAMIFGAAPQ